MLNVLNTWVCFHWLQYLHKAFCSQDQHLHPRSSGTFWLHRPFPSSSPRPFPSWLSPAQFRSLLTLTLTCVIVSQPADLLPPTASSLHFKFHNTCDPPLISAQGSLPNLPFEAPWDAALITRRHVCPIWAVLFSTWETIIRIFLVSFIPMSYF